MHHHLTPQFILDKWANGEQNGRFPAVTLFLDLSGFTPLCAHLRQYGKAGAEELAKLMDQIFHPLIGSIYAHDGFVAGFAGDAFKAVFPTLRPESHVAALAAAQQIRAAMVANEEIATPFGSFTLTSRTSLASGEVSWRIWTAEEGAAYGQSQAYTFAGDALDAAIAGELLAEAGGLVMTQTVYEVLQPLVNLTAVPHLNHNYFTLTAVHAPLPQHPTPPAPATTSPVGNFYPATLLTQRTPGEFRHVISLFLNIEEPDSKETDSAFMTTFFRLLHQYGGFLCRIGRGGASEAGRTFVLFWGAPTARENDIDRALNFMLDLQTAVSPATRMRAGLTYQMVYAGFVGSPLCEEYTCYGLHVNLAARLMVTSPWGEIWLDEAVATHAQEGFRVAFADKRPFKGFAAPLNVYRLESIKLDPLTSFFQREMVGRASEMEQLQTAVQPIFNNNFGGLITVAGEAGIGKSRLVHQFLDQLASQQSFTLLRCQTDEILRESLNPFRYSLRYYFAQHPTQSEAENKANFDSKFSQLIDHTKEAALRTELIRTRSFLGALVDLQWPDSLYESLEPNLRQENSFIALKSLIQAESLRQPLIVQLEDSHWLDEDSARFLRELTHDAAAHPFLILSTTRDVEAHSPATEVPYHLVLLDMLPAGEVNQLAEKLLQTAVSPELITFLMNRTEGNPFFVEQMVLYLQEQQLLEPSTAGVVAKTAVSDLPDTIQAILIARIDRLSQAVREVVQTAAVLGREFDVQVLSAMLQGEATVSEKIKTAESAAIWSALSELRYLFRHALLRDAAYGMQIQAHRQQLHQLAAHTIETLYKADLTPYYTDLALHFGQARQTVKAAHYAALAGKQAAYQFDNKTAVDYLTQALDLTPLNDVAKRLDLLLTREAVYGQQGAREKQAADLTELQTIAAQLENPEQKIDILRRETEFALFTSDYPRAIRAAQQAVALAQATDHLVLHTQTKISFGNVLMRQGEVTAAQEQLEQAYALAHQTQSSREQALCAQNLSYVYMRMGAFEKGKTYGLRAFELAQEIDNWGQVGFALTNVGTCCMHLGQIDEAEHYYTQSLEAKRKVGDRYGESGAVHNLGNAAYYQGKLDETATRFAQALKLKRAVGDREGEGMMYHNLGLLYQTLGFFEQSKAHYEKSLAISQELNASARLAATKQIFGLLLHYLGEQSTAQSYCEEALAHARQKDLRPHQANALNNLGYILAAQGHVDKARAALLEAIALRQESKQENLAIEAMAGLLPLPGNTEQDQQIWLETTLGFLETKGTNGMLEPSRVHLTCYQALAQQNDVRAAPLLQKAYAQLMEQANKLADPAAKHAFLNNVVANQAIVELHKNDTISA